MSLNKDFRLACIEAGYNKSCFTSEMHSWDDLQVCHILSKSKTTLNAIKKAYNCSNKTAELIMNMPLLNTVIGSRQDNAEYKKTEDIQYIDKTLVSITINIINDMIFTFTSKDFDNLMNVKIFKEFYYMIFYFSKIGYFYLDSLVKEVKDIQLQFHREINLYT